MPNYLPYPNQPERDSKPSATPPVSLSMAYLEPLETKNNGQTESHGLLEYLQLLRGHRVLLLVMLAVGTVAGCLVSWLQVPVYEARSYLEFQSQGRGEAGVLGDKDGGGGFGPENFLQTQVRVLESRSLRKRIEDKFASDPGAEAPPSRFRAVRKFFGLATPALAKGHTRSVEVAAHIIDNSRIVEIVCESSDARYSAAFANAMAHEYIEYSLESIWESSSRTSQWMNKQLEHLKKNLEESENRLQEYGRQTGLVYTGAEQSIEEDTLKQLQQEYSTAKADRIAKQSLSEIAAASQAEAIPQVADNGHLSEYSRKMADLKQELAELLSLYTPSHPRVMKVQAQITALESTLTGERKSIRKRIDNEYGAAERREQLLAHEYQKQMETLLETDHKSVYYDVLKHEVATDRAIYDQLLAKTKQVEVGASVQASDIRLLDAAEVPLHPTKPNLPRNASFGFLFGLVGAFGIVVGREFIDRSVRAPGESPLHLQVPELGVIPSQRYFPQPRDHRNPDAASEESSRFELASWQDHPSLLAESFRSTLASIMVSGHGSTLPGVLMITSAGKGEGKSTVASNLGIALAEINLRVLLIDADMRKPHLHDIFSVSNSWGLSDLLRERSALDSCPVEALSRKTDLEGLSLLPSGPGTLSIANLLYSRRLADLLARLRTEFDIIVIDTPPMLYISDARVLGRLTDGAILVIRASKTTRDAARAAKQRLVADGIPVLGTILNEWDFRGKSRYGYYTSYTY